MPARSKRTNAQHPPQLIISFPDGTALFDPEWSTRVVSFNGVATLELADRTQCKFKPGDEVPPGLLFKPTCGKKPAKATVVTKLQSLHWPHPFSAKKFAQA